MSAVGHRSFDPYSDVVIPTDGLRTRVSSLPQTRLGALQLKLKFSELSHAEMRELDTLERAQYAPQVAKPSPTRNYCALATAGLGLAFIFLRIFR